MSLKVSKISVKEIRMRLEKVESKIKDWKKKILKKKIESSYR